MILRIKPLVGKEQTIEVEPTDLVETIKAKLQEVEGTAADQQRLRYRGVFLKDNKTIESYRLKNGYTLEMIKALRSK